ncbi:hypothetical protein [Paenibacillus periandrae]|nr:hypothetical protein [Paenibacillus periandrae]
MKAITLQNLTLWKTNWGFAEVPLQTETIIGSIKTPVYVQASDNLNHKNN